MKRLFWIVGLVCIVSTAQWQDDVKYSNSVKRHKQYLKETGRTDELTRPIFPHTSKKRKVAPRDEMAEAKAALAVNAELRVMALAKTTWADKKGREIAARVIKSDGFNITLKTPRGRVLVVKKSSFCAHHRDLLMYLGEDNNSP